MAWNLRGKRGTIWHTDLGCVSG